MKNKKLKQEELQQITDIQTRSQAVLTELGQIELLKLQLKARRQNAENFLIELEKEEKTLAEFLESTYGKGSINLEKGEFISLKEEEVSK